MECQSRRGIEDCQGERSQRSLVGAGWSDSDQPSDGRHHHGVGGWRFCRRWLRPKPRNSESLGRGTKHLSDRGCVESDVYNICIVAARCRAYGVAVGNADELAGSPIRGTCLGRARVSTGLAFACPTRMLPTLKKRHRGNVQFWRQKRTFAEKLTSAER